MSAVETRNVNYSGKNRIQYKRVCKKCNEVSWVFAGSTLVRDVCSKCYQKSKSHISIRTDHECMPQNEDENRRMIDEWLANNKPTVIENSFEAPKKIHKEEIVQKEVSPEAKMAREINREFQFYFQEQDYKKELTVKDFDKVEDYFDYYEALKLREQMRSA